MLNRLAKWFQPSRRPVRRPAANRRPRLFSPSLEALEDRLQLSGTPASLGAAAQFAVLEVNGGSLTLNSSHIVGNIGQGPNSTSVLQKTDDQGTFFYDPTSNPDLSNVGKDFLVSGGIVQQNLSQAVSDANAASAADAALAPTLVLGNVTSSITVTSVDASNVISLGSLNYNGKTLTIQGGANDTFVFNVSGGFSFYQSKILLSGGVTADHVLFNFPTTGSMIDLSKSSNVINGTFLAPYRSLNYHNPAAFNGAVIAQTINIHSDGNLTGVPFTPPAPATPMTDLSITKSDGVDTVKSGDGVTYTYTITVTNNGTVDAQDVMVTDVWPSGFRQGTISNPYGSVTTGDGGNFTASLGTVAAGASKSITVTFTVPYWSLWIFGPQTNTATVSSSTPDSNPDNNTASDTDLVLSGSFPGGA